MHIDAITLQRMIEMDDSADIYIRKVRCLKPHLKKIADREGYDDNDLVIVRDNRTLELITGSPIEYLQSNLD